MPTIRETLLKSGFTEDAVKALDAKLLSAVEAYGTEVQAGAQTVLDRAELERRASEDMYNNQITPALNKWSNEEADLRAQVAFYKTQAETAKTAGFIPTEAPGYKPRAADGTFTPGGNPVPGSPGINVQEFRDAIGGAFNDGMWALQQYASLNPGQFLTEDVTALAREAEQQKLPFRDYVDRKFQFTAKRQKLEADRLQKDKDDYAAGKVAERDKYWAERTSGNPNVRQAVSSEFTEIRKGVADKTRPDPLSVPREQRHQNTSRAIQSEIATRVQ